MFKHGVLRLYCKLHEVDKAQGYVEYLFILAFVAVAAGVGLGLLGTNINAAFNAVAGKV